MRKKTIARSADKPLPDRETTGNAGTPLSAEDTAERAGTSAEDMKESAGTPLREGFTTGSAATAAALAALRLLLTGKAPTAVAIPLPPFTNGKERARLTVPVEACSLMRADSRTAAPSAASAGMQRGSTSARTLDSSAGSSPAAHGTPPATTADARTADCSTPPIPTADTSNPFFHAAAWPAATALVIKDGGDDPDATAHARIRVCLSAALHHGDSTTPVHVTLEGGAGVGRVTLPGLPMPVGQPAINPAPREQITRAVQMECRARALCGEIRVIISVEDGETLARQTMNARLGIVGGISILGTQGIVKPFSHSAWQASVLQGLRVARAVQCRSICLSTGRRSEKLLMALRPNLPEPAFVQAADFAGFSLRAAGELGFTDIVWGCFFGKLVKLAQGLEYTHAHTAALDIPLLTRLAAEAGMEDIAALGQCITANHALEHLLAHTAGPAVIRRLGGMAQANAQAFAGRPVSLILFHLDGRTLLTL